MKNLELFFDDNVTRLINSFSHCFNVRITIFSTDLSKKLAVDFNDEHCRYCRHVRKTLALGYRCDRQDREMCGLSEKSSDPLVYICHSGLVDTAISIRLDGLLIGYAMVGQFRTQAAVPPDMIRLWEEKGLNPDILQNAFAEQAYFEKTEVDNMLNLFSMLCNYIVSRDYIRFRQPNIAGQALRWIEDHISRPILIEELAEYLGYSHSAISHSIKRQTNLSFKRLCILKKIEAFEKILEDNPNLSIEKAADKIGYEDPFYFSRLYKKIRLVSPSAYIKSIRGRAR
ncbi:MAG: PocR ligand-binding domain-containing protein [Treponema sp.]|jgi:AraC-like DNA-binding protein|nr:PocR ligand-binding domain-containing protein [Treponema sp.]